jgi:hypothetical protein
MVGLENRFFNFQTFSQFANPFEFKSNLNFDDFYSHSKMEELHHHKKKICNDMKYNNQLYKP